MKILWLCNIVLPEFCSIYNIKANKFGGWLTGMWNELKKKSELELAICAPIIDRDRIKFVHINGINCYAFHMSLKENEFDEQIDDFINILNQFKPDVIHIWGTEYQHTLAMVCAAERLGIVNKVVINIQGLISKVQNKYCYGLTDPIIYKENSDGNSIFKAWQSFAKKEKYEIEAIEKVFNVIGRTDWDRAGSTQLNRDLKYHKCGEILREIFYEHTGEWNRKSCEEHTIFISQSNYPIKGLHLVIFHLAKLKELFPNLHVYIAGTNICLQEDTYGKLISDLIRKYKLESTITFLGILSQEDMYQYYLKANVFLSASTIENSSNSICEAMAIGVPVVASMVGGTPDLVSHKDSGFLYALGEEYMMQFYIEKLFNNTELCESISVNATKKILGLIDRERNSKKTIQIYREIVRSEKERGEKNQ